MAPSRRITLKEVAQHAGVSYQTVSKLLNHQVRLSPETEARIHAAIHELDYRPLYMARGLRSRQSHTLGYSWQPAHPGASNPILDAFLQSMLQAAEREDYHLLCFPYHADPQRHLDAYRELYETGRVDGFILSSIEYDDPRVLYLLEHGVPFAAFGRSNPGLVFPCIDVDGGEGLRLAVAHLAGLGHQHIAVLAWPESSRVGNNRLEGYQVGMTQAGLGVRAEWVMRGEGQANFGFVAAQQLLDLPAGQRPTAIVALNDAMALGAMRAAQRRGVAMGHDLAVTGFDDVEAARYVQPPLTTLRQPIWEVGQRLIHRLLSQLQQTPDASPACELLPPRLIVRASSQPTVSPDLDVDSIDLEKDHAD